jgi:hypothetical protein
LDGWGYFWDKEGALLVKKLYVKGALEATEEKVERNKYWPITKQALIKMRQVPPNLMHS